MLLLLFEITRTRKLPSDSSETVHVRPHVSPAPPRITVCWEVVSWVSVFVAVQDAPPSQDRSTLMLLVPGVASSHQSSRTSMPEMEQALEMEIA